MEEQLLKQIKQQKERLMQEQKLLNELEYKYLNWIHVPSLKEKYVGKFLKYPNNCYSCPSLDSDYWDVYYYITSVNENGCAEAICFEKDSYGEIRIKKEQIYNIDQRDLKEIGRGEFVDMWNEMIKEINELGDSFL